MFSVLDELKGCRFGGLDGVTEVGFEIEDVVCASG